MDMKIRVAADGTYLVAADGAGRRLLAWEIMYISDGIGLESNPYIPVPALFNSNNTFPSYSHQLLLTIRLHYL